MAWSIWDDRRFGSESSVECGGCGASVNFWVEFTRNEKHFQLCWECLSEARDEAKKRRARIPIDRIESVKFSDLTRRPHFTKAEKQTVEAQGWGIRLWSDRHKPIWWRPEAHGYTDDIAAAGLFTEERARKQDGPRYEEGPERDEAVSPYVMLRMAENELQRTEDRAAALRVLIAKLKKVMECR